jgi:hypothetical protein
MAVVTLKLQHCHPIGKGYVNPADAQYALPKAC